MIQIGLNEIIYTTESSGNWILASLEYASYNSILLIPMLIGLKKYAYKKEKSIAITVTLILGALAVILYTILKSGGTVIQNVELPLIYIVNQFEDMYKYIYGIVIVSAIYTSAIAAGYGFVENCSIGKKSYKKLCMLICASAIIVSRIGFSYLVSMLYPMFGILGLIQLIYILLIYKRVEKRRKN